MVTDPLEASFGRLHRLAVCNPKGLGLGLDQWMGYVDDLTTSQVRCQRILVRACRSVTLSSMGPFTM